MNPDGLEWVLYPPHLNGMKRFEDTDIARLIAKVPLAVPSGEVEGLRVEGPGNSIVSGPVSRAEYLKQHLNKSLSVSGLAKGRGDVTLVHDKPAELRDKFQDISDACAELENRFNVSPKVDLTSCNAWEPIPYDIFTGLNVVSVRRG